MDGVATCLQCYCDSHHYLVLEQTMMLPPISKHTISKFASSTRAYELALGSASTRYLKKVMRGLFIVVEGCDRSGKSTQCERLLNRFKAEGRDARLVKFPDRTTQTGQMIDGYLKQSRQLDDHAIHLLFSANRWEAMDQLAGYLKAGTTLIVDRYAFSGVAFSAAKGLDLEWCKQSDVGLLIPDKVMFLDLPIEKAEKRGGFGDERYEVRDLQIKVRDLFMELKGDNWKIIDADQSMDAVHEEMWNIVRDLKLESNEPRFGLWKQQPKGSGSNHA
ncbi:thymidylate kinase-domain-containing protein [Fennellomyces sp. T-0311]|nr:thymidylate kinase-domain-containing protein [Fennellomyces sp. T-0311]